MQLFIIFLESNPDLSGGGQGSYRSYSGQRLLITKQKYAKALGDIWVLPGP